MSGVCMSSLQTHMSHDTRESMIAMHRKALTFAILSTVLIVGEAAAQVGQPWTDRFYVNINAGFESTSGTMTDAVTIRVNPSDIETGTLSVSQNVDSGSLIDISLGARVWRNASFGLGFHRGSTSGEGALQASIPNPFFFDRPRNVAMSVSGLDRTEHALHLQFGYMLPITERLDIHIMVGPSFFRVKQEVINGVTWTENAFPFATVNADALVAGRSENATGANIGADISYEFLQSVANL
jgi:hypothetical protein